MSNPLAQSIECHPDLLHDESQLTGQAESVCFPRDTAEVCDVLRAGAGRDRPTLTVQGARTGITGGAVPAGGLILNLSRMDRILGLRLASDGSPLLRVQAGLTLAALRRWLLAPAELPGVAPDVWRAFSRRRWRFTPDPTEATASIGGMVACNASGACSFLHGATRDWIERLQVVLADGGRLELSREHGPHARGRTFSLAADGEGSDPGAIPRVLSGALPSIVMPAVKHAAGYWVRDDMALIDLLIGSEGTLGVVTEIELRLAPRPAIVWGIHLMLASEPMALLLVEAVRSQAGPSRMGLGAALSAMEYFDGAALALLRRVAGAGTVGYPVPPADAGCALYLELEGDDAAALATAAEAVSRQFAAAGGCDGQSWVASSPADVERLKAFRHAVPESVNQVIAQRRRDHPGLTKVGTDLAVPDARLGDVMALYREGLARTGLEGVIFGHIGNNHLHVNILPRDLAEHRQAKALYGEWAERCLAWGGTVSAEHGIGKLKTALLEKLYGEAGLCQMRRVKAVFDPDLRLNRGTLFATEG